MGVKSTIELTREQAIEKLADLLAERVRKNQIAWMRHYPNEKIERGLEKESEESFNNFVIVDSL